MARLSRALSDDALLPRVRRLMAEWAKTIEPDGYFFYSRKPITPHYIFDKTISIVVSDSAYLVSCPTLISLPPRCQVTPEGTKGSRMR